MKSGYIKQFITFFVLAVFIGIVLSCQETPYLILNSNRTFFYSRNGGTQSIIFSTNRDWSITSSESWCDVSPSSGLVKDGDIMVSISVENNSTYDERNCTLTIKVEDLIETLHISQEKGVGFIVSPTTFELTNIAQSIEIDIKNNVQYNISIDDACKNWIKHINTKALTSEKALFDIAANDTYDNREGVIHFIREDGIINDVHISQRQQDALFISSIPNRFSYKKQTFTVTVRSNIAFQISSNDNWISQISTKALQDSTLVLSIEENPSYEKRVGNVTIMPENDSIHSYHIHITQNGKPFDLSYAGTANCYIVPLTNDAFCFNASIAGNDVNKDYYNISEGDHIKIVWEAANNNSQQELLKDLDYEQENNRIVFNTRGYEGNVLIALQDKKDKILWSWHLWLTNYNPSIDYITFNNGAVLQDRYLGASSDESIGLYYEWGRKDPFSPKKYKSIIPDESSGTVAYSISHPDIFMSNNYKLTDWDWNYEHTAIWSSSKTVHDPCPPGWKVMDGYPLCLPSIPIDYKAEYNNSCIVYGAPICSPNIKFRTTGLLHSAGDIQGTEEHVSVWTNYGYYYMFSQGLYLSIDTYYNEYSYKTSGSGRAYGKNIRCQRE